MITLPEEIRPITDSLLEQGCFPVLVGGYIRDTLLQKKSTDIDIEVYAVNNLETLQKMLEPFGSVNLVGKSFGILKLALFNYDVDFSLPRRESKKTGGHRGFTIYLSGQMDFATASLRRDFTINAIGYDINTSLLLDPYGGQKDLQSRMLRCVNEQTFIEDPLRVLRAVQMAARFNLTCDETLLKLMKNMVSEGALRELPKERIFGELKKLLLKAAQPSIGFKLMDTLGILDFFPELENLKATSQEDSKSDIRIHTLMAVDAMANLRTNVEKQNLVLMLAAVCLDCEKSSSAVSTEKKPDAIGHQKAEVNPVKTFLQRFTDEKHLIQEVLSLVAHHKRPIELYQQQSENSEIRRLSMEVKISDLILVSKADFLGYTHNKNKKDEFPAGNWLLQRAASLHINNNPLKPLIQGRDLVKAGLKPSKTFKTILDDAFEAQIDGEFTNENEALIWLKNYLAAR